MKREKLVQIQIFCKYWIIPWSHTVVNYGREGRGVALFVENSIHFKPRLDLDVIGLNSFESIFIEITNHKKQIMVIGTIYRTPYLDINKFNGSFDLLLSKLKRQKTKYILAVDYNISLLHYDKHSETEQFLNHIFSYSCLRQLHDRQGLVQQPLL